MTPQDIKTLRSFLGTESWSRIRVQLLNDCPKGLSAKTDVDLLRAAIGFNYWNQAIAQLETYADTKPKAEKIDTSTDLETEEKD